MTLIQHKDYRIRYQQQVDNAREYVMPFIEKAIEVRAGMEVLDIGCGEGGVLVPFLEKGCKAVGIELDEDKSAYARELLSSYLADGVAEIANHNIYDEASLKPYISRFDLIILKDVVEHIPDQSRFIPYLKKFLKPGGHIYFGFPPWYMPHGGHQQVCANKFLSMLPYFHLLPVRIYSSLLSLFGEDKGVVKELLEIKETGISTARFERIVHNSGFEIAARTFYLINPIYRYKFGWKPREQFGLIAKIPYLRDFVTTCAYYLLRV